MQEEAASADAEAATSNPEDQAGIINENSYTKQQSLKWMKQLYTEEDAI